MQIKIPYGKTFLKAEADEGRVLVPQKMMNSGESGFEIVRRAMENPIGTPKLSELARGKRHCVLILSDHTRPVPSKDIVPHMLRELREGNPDIEITLLIATGFHRGSLDHELRKKLGGEIVDREKIVVHNAMDENANVPIGVLPSGAPLIIDSLAADADLLIAEGFIEPHFFAGFSGGRKSVLPGIASKETVFGNHCGKFIASPYARTGVLDENPVHRDMDKAAELAHLQYIVNVVIDENQKTVAAFAGDFRKAHEAGVAFLRPNVTVPSVPGDIIVTGNGGFPLDQNIYQCVKCMTAAEAAAKEKATIIVCAEAADGIGGDGIYRTMRDCHSPEEQYQIFSMRPQGETQADQWQTQILCRVLMKHRVIFVTRPELANTIREMKMEYAPNLESAIRMAGNGDITWIPNGVSVIVKSN